VTYPPLARVSRLRLRRSHSLGSMGVCTPVFPTNGLRQISYAPTPQISFHPYAASSHATKHANRGAVGAGLKPAPTPQLALRWGRTQCRSRNTAARHRPARTESSRSCESSQWHCTSPPVPTDLSSIGLWLIQCNHLSADWCTEKRLMGIILGQPQRTYHVPPSQ